MKEVDEMRAMKLAIFGAATLLTVNSAGAQATAAATKPGNIVEVAVGAKFNTLVAAVKAAGLAEALQGAGPFTVFAPTDAAFAKLPAGTVAVVAVQQDAAGDEARAFGEIIVTVRPNAPRPPPVIP
jgi:uncharacterized surface protein with fasciclin (FAS1) repeats